MFLVLIVQVKIFVQRMRIIIFMKMLENIIDLEVFYMR